MYKSIDEMELFEKFDYIGSDGILPIIIQRCFGMRITNRYSFDMSSVAPAVFDYAIANNMTIYFIGSTHENINEFIQNLKNNYPDIMISGFHHGYIDGNEKSVAKQIISSSANIVIIGMGAPAQERFSVFLREYGFSGTIYTCGGFIHQASNKFYYFNGWIDKFHLRTIYRWYKEPHVICRLKYYPSFILTYTKFCLIKKMAKSYID
jgi:N-acetylglucosaminyldiphosphoundecaprenol N-acetyl-beta-D-mannosaminyltransferase